MSDRPESHRQWAESFGSNAEQYDRTRPHYPRALIERIIKTSPGRDILDVGCGTGIVARQLQAADCNVLGVEIDPRMAEFARHRGLEVDVSKFEEWDAAGRRFDAVVAGQTWHWIDPLGGAMKARAVLRPGGRLAVFWNAAHTTPDLADALAAVYLRVVPDSPLTPRWGSNAVNGYLALCDRAAAGMRHAGLFDDPDLWRFDWEQSYTRDEWLDQVPTFGGHSRFPPETLAEILSGLGTAIDAVGGRFTMHYTTVVTTATRAATT